jgi:hypothetical protein
MRLNMLHQLVLPRQSLITNATTPRHRTRKKLSISLVSLEMAIQIVFACERGQMSVVKTAGVQADPRPPAKTLVSGIR